LVSGSLHDPQGQAVSGVHVSAVAPGQNEPLAEAESQDDGAWTIALTEASDDLTLVFERPHFEPTRLSLDAEGLADLNSTGTYNMGELTLERMITPAFRAATLIFLVVLLLIAFEKLHSTTAALAGISAIFLLTFLGEAFDERLYIFSFERAL